MQKFGEHIYFIPGNGYSSNSVLIKDRVIALADPGLPNNEPLLRELKKLDVEPKDVQFVIDVEPHVDHCGGNYFFHKAKLIGSKETATAVERADPDVTAARAFGLKLHKCRFQKRVKDGDILSFGETKLQVIKTPGHTSGNISLYEKRLRLLICGDLIFADSIGRTDLPTGDAEVMYQSIKRVSELDIDYVLPGHGPPGRKESVAMALDLAQVVRPMTF